MKFELYKRNVEFYVLFNLEKISFCIENDLNFIIDNFYTDVIWFPYNVIDHNLIEKSNLILSVDDINDFKKLIPEEFI